mmetsp:Transcript_9619/g.23863  ORF Transcript_9619/g.23863 Transcript_9619/m.23863 type:complete len:277 (+) Transcript_9619:605-1435(+)
MPYTTSLAPGSGWRIMTDSTALMPPASLNAARAPSRLRTSAASAYSPLTTTSSCGSVVSATSLANTSGDTCSRSCWKCALLEAAVPSTYAAAARISLPSAATTGWMPFMPFRSLALSMGSTRICSACSALTLSSSPLSGAVSCRSASRMSCASLGCEFMMSTSSLTRLRFLSSMSVIASSSFTCAACSASTFGSLCSIAQCSNDSMFLASFFCSCPSAASCAACRSTASLGTGSFTRPTYCPTSRAVPKATHPSRHKMAKARCREGGHMKLMCPIA